MINQGALWSRRNKRKLLRETPYHSSASMMEMSLRLPRVLSASAAKVCLRFSQTRASSFSMKVQAGLLGGQPRAYRRSSSAKRGQVDCEAKDDNRELLRTSSLAQPWTTSNPLPSQRSCRFRCSTMSGARSSVQRRQAYYGGCAAVPFRSLAAPFRTFRPLDTVCTQFDVY